MKTTGKCSALFTGCCLAGLVVLGASCSRPRVASADRTQSATRALSPVEAAQLAERLANEESQRLYKRRPFAASQHPAVLQDGEYQWGGLDPGAPGGYSALVTFAQDGSHPKVEVYFSSDQLSPLR